MAVGAGVTEVADSEEEPLTSSPTVVSDAAMDKLSATAGQDAQAVACLLQGPAKPTANEVVNRTDGFNVDQDKSSSNVDTTHIDHSNLQSVQQTDINNSSTCIAKGQGTADVPAPLVDSTASNADCQTSTINANHPDCMSTSLRDTEVAPGTENVIPPIEHTSTPRDIEMKSSNDDTGEQQREPQQNLLLQLPLHSGNVDVAQDDLLRERSQEAFGSLTATLELSQNDFGEPPSDRQTTVQGRSAVDAIVQDQEDTDKEALAGQPQHDSVFGSSVELFVPTVVESPDTSIGVNYASSRAHATDSSNCIEVDPSSAATNLAETRITTAQYVAAAGPLSPHDGRSSREDPDRKPGTEVELTSKPPPGIGLTTVTKNDNCSGHSGSLNDSTARSTTSDAHEPCKNQQASNDTVPGVETQGPTLSDEATVQAPAVATTQQSPDAGLVPVISAEAVQEQPSKLLAQSVIETSPPPPEEAVKIESRITSASTTAEAQFHTQSDPSQASEPASPQLAAKLTPQEITLAQLNAQKAALLASLATLPAIQMLMEENQSSDVDMSNDDEHTEADITSAANKMVKEHIKLLHEYNELKDIGQGLMGLIADQRGVRIVEVQDEFGIDAND